ncbi:MAG: tetratricopeptide repeat protein [Candidatus Rokubacteria bacterium]|nr:tetratricopeptide repeat protein [Candidatus Rokubacteria bacterium]
MILLLAGCGTWDTAADGALRDGDESLGRRKLREALGHFRQAVAQAPASAAAHARRGAVAEVLGELDEAMDAYYEAARREPSALAYYRVGALAARMGATDGGVQWLGASAGMERGWRERLAEPGARWARAARTRLAGSWLAPVTPVLVFRLLGGLEGRLAGAWFDREIAARALFALHVEAGQRDAALDLARRRGWVEPGADYCRPGHPRGPATAALLAMLLDPARADCLLETGTAWTLRGLARLGRAALLDRAQRSTDPGVRQRAATFLRARLPAHEVVKLAETLNLIGDNLADTWRHPAEAIAAYRRAIAGDPRFSWPYRNIGLVYERQKDAPQAMEWFRKAAAVNPDHWRARLSLGAAHYERREWREALEHFGAAVALAPDDAGSHADLGRTLLRLGREPEGVRELSIAVRIDPNLRSAREWLDARFGRDPRGGPTPFSSR